jgi:hypothetical protein
MNLQTFLTAKKAENTKREGVLRPRVRRSTDPCRLKVAPAFAALI